MPEGRESRLHVVIRAEHDSDVLDRDQEDEAPENERNDSEDVAGGGPLAHALLKRIERAGADVSKYDPQGGNGVNKDGFPRSGLLVHTS